MSIPFREYVDEQGRRKEWRELDQADPVAGSYTLEVSTPGLSRPLHTARDFRRQRGHEVSIIRDRTPGAPSTQEGEVGRTGKAGAARVAASPSVQGLVVDVDDEAVVLDVDGDQVRVPLSEVVRGKVVLPW